MPDLGTVLWAALGLYALMTGVFIILENRRPPSTLAWMLLFVFAPGVGLLIYLFFGRDRKPFSKRSDLLRQELRADALPVLAPLRAREDAEFARVERESPAHRKLLALVRRNSSSTLTGRNRIEILQDAAEFYPRLVEDMQAARHSIRHQYFIWRSDALTERWKDLLIEKARAGVEGRCREYPSLRSVCVPPDARHLMVEVKLGRERRDRRRTGAQEEGPVGFVEHVPPSVEGARWPSRVASWRAAPLGPPAPQFATELREDWRLPGLVWSALASRFQALRATTASARSTSSFWSNRSRTSR